MPRKTFQVSCDIFEAITSKLSLNISADILSTYILEGASLNQIFVLQNWNFKVTSIKVMRLSHSTNTHRCMYLKWNIFMHVSLFVIETLIGSQTSMSFMNTLLELPKMLKFTSKSLCNMCSLSTKIQAKNNRHDTLKT